MYLSSKVDLFEDASEYKGQHYCWGAYDTLFEIDRKKANLSVHGAVE